MMKWSGDNPRLVRGKFLHKGEEVPEGAFSPEEIASLVERGKIALDVEVEVIAGPEPVAIPEIKVVDEPTVEPVIEAKPEPEPLSKGLWGFDKKAEKTAEKVEELTDKKKAKTSKKKRSKS